mgnify:CR=1 FL=1
MMGRLLPQYYYASHGKHSANDVIIIQPIVSEILWNLTLTLAGRALLYRITAELLTGHYRGILISRETLPSQFRHRYGHMLRDMVGFIYYPLAITVRASHHPYRLTAAGTVI